MKKKFQPFLKTPNYKTIGCFDKTIGCFDKTIGCFSLSLKNTFLLKSLRMPMLWIQSMIGLQYSIYPKSYLRQLSNSKHNLAFNILQRVWILQSLNTTWFNTHVLFLWWMPENTKTRGALEVVCTPTLKSVLGLGNTETVQLSLCVFKRRKWIAYLSKFVILLFIDWN